MRSRPKVKVYLSPRVVAPGGRLVAEAVLTAKSETPVDFVAISLGCEVVTVVGSGNQRASNRVSMYAREWRSPSFVMQPGEHRHRVAFDIPESAPPGYDGNDGHVRWILRVHVSIPWWPDRDASFVVPVAFAERPPPSLRPAVVATSREGPRGKDPFLEVALETTQIGVGEVLSGSVSLGNLRGRKIRGVDVSFVEVERITLPAEQVREARRYTLRVHEGAPAEGDVVPFRVRVPDSATPTFYGGPLQLSTHVEVKADVAWGSDVVVRVPTVVTPRVNAPRAGRGRVAPVGRERRALVWQAAAARAGLTPDLEGERMLGTRGISSIEIRTEQTDADFWLVAILGWPSMGLDLAVRERRWTDALASELVRSGDPELDARIAVRVREPAQAEGALARDLLAALASFEEIEVDDAGARLGSRGSAHVNERLDPFVTGVLAIADAITAAHARIGPPRLFAADVPAWQAFAERVRGRLELGRMWIHDGRMGLDRVEVGTVWGRKGELLGTTAIVAVDPPLARAPASPDDPELSPAARDAFRGLAALARGVRVEPGAVTVEMEGRLADPAAATPALEQAVALRRALAGMVGQGPFR